MAQNLNWYKQALLKQYSYSVPQDKKQIMFDFYMFSLLRASSFQYMWYGTIKEQLEEASEDIESKLLPALKEELLNATLIAIASEYSHAYAFASTEQMAEAMGSRDYRPLIDDLHSSEEEFYSLRKRPDRNKIIPENMRRTLRKEDEEDSHLLEYLLVKEKIGDHGISDAKFVDLASRVFSKLDWKDEPYGGENWAKICEVWAKVNNAKTAKDLTMSMDLLYSMHHNTGSVFDKLPSYYMDFSDQKTGIAGPDGILECLDLKFSAKNPWALYDFCSPAMQTFASPAISAVGKSNIKGRFDKAHAYGSRSDFRNSEEYNDGNLTLSSAIIAGEKSLLNFIKHYDPKNITDFHLELADETGNERIINIVRHKASEAGSLAEADVNLLVKYMMQGNRQMVEYIATYHDIARISMENLSYQGYTIEDVLNIASFYDILTLREIIQNILLMYMQNTPDGPSAYKNFPIELKMVPQIRQLAAEAYSNAFMKLNIEDVRQMLATPAAKSRIENDPAMKDAVENLNLETEYEGNVGN